MNRNKSKDEYDISAEHLIMAKDILAPFLRILFNKILQQKITPAAFKTGILFPVLKREKDSTVLNNYRGITVTPTIGKTFEYALIEKIDFTNLSELQFGFTAGLMPLMSSLIISESKCEQKYLKEPLIIGVMDVKSAFDVVQHTIMLDKLLDIEKHPTIWLLIKNMYEGLTTKVKWMGGLSDSFQVKQGVRQGGVLSTHLYKLFLQDLLLELEHNAIGLHLGNIYVGTPIPVLTT